MSDYLCEELIVEIFTRLPPKSLIRFRSLSKSLCSCISSPGFIRMHAIRSPQKILLRHGRYSNKNQEADFYTLHGEDQLPLCPKHGYIGITTVQFPKNTPFRIVGSVNGTFCLRIKNSLCLWNPSVRRFLRVPECPQKSELPWEGIGFGFDPISDDFNIVWTSNSRKSSFVYAVKIGDWHVIASPTPLFSCVSFEAFFFNGTLHWEVLCFQDIELSGILTFNLSTHIFGLIPLPGPTWLWGTTGITTIQDSLALISYRMDVDDSWIRVWRDSSWSVVFKLEIGTLSIERALQLTNNGDLLLDILEEGVQVYNPKTGLRSKLVNFNPASCLINMLQYVETLHLLDMGTAWETNQPSNLIFD